MISAFAAAQNRRSDDVAASAFIAEGYRIGETQKKKLLKVAEEYERLADRAAQWQTVSDVERKKQGRR